MFETLEDTQEARRKRRAAQYILNARENRSTSRACTARTCTNMSDSPCNHGLAAAAPQPRICNEDRPQTGARVGLTRSFVGTCLAAAVLAAVALTRQPHAQSSG